jgi:DNA-binding MarR family transcriptional regulator
MMPKSGLIRRDQDFIQRLGGDIASISACLEELRHFRARTLGITVPQWKILSVLADMEDGNGLPVGVVSKMLQVEPSFVTTQSKLLDSQGFIRRRASSKDARVVNLSLTEKTRAYLGNFASQRETLNEFIFAEFAPRELEELTRKLGSLRKTLEKAYLKVTAGF